MQVPMDKTLISGSEKPNAMPSSIPIKVGLFAKIPPSILKGLLIAFWLSLYSISNALYYASHYDINGNYKTSVINDDVHTLYKCDQGHIFFM